MLESCKSPFQNHCSPLTRRFLDLFDIYSRAAACLLHDCVALAANDDRGGD